MSRPGRNAPSVAHVTIDVTVMICVGLSTTIRRSGAAGFCASLVVGAGLASGLAIVELAGASFDWGCISAPSAPLLGL